jgi:uncharacterized protein
MSARPASVDIPLDRVDHDALDRFLRSEHAPDSMSLSELDGFLTGIAVGPEIIMPSEWMPVVWGAGGPDFTDEQEAAAILGAILSRYTEILAELRIASYAPILDKDRDGRPVASGWANGFMHAALLRKQAWAPLSESESDRHLILPIVALCGNGKGKSLLSISAEEMDSIREMLTGLIPTNVMAINAYWRTSRRQRLTGASTGAQSFRTDRTRVKVGRNAPCPCGSGRKFKRCCGLAE